MYLTPLFILVNGKMYLTPLFILDGTLTRWIMALSAAPLSPVFA
jgi:hypothetical protein